MPKSDRAGELLRIYVAEEQTHRGVLLWEWLLQQASAPPPFPWRWFPP